jgi:hypothetical protein
MRSKLSKAALNAHAVSSRRTCTIRRRTHDGLGGDIRGSTRPVLDDERLIQPF